jgi:hypothetical protein
MTCIEITDTYEDQWSRYRQVSFNVISADCVYEYVRYEVNAAGDINPDVNETLKVSVWPMGEPSHDGKLVDLDAEAPGPIILDLYSGTFFTTRTSEKATYREGYPWFNLTEQEVADLTCVTLENSNLGNYVTGYVQYLFQAVNNGEACTETITV